MSIEVEKTEEYIIVFCTVPDQAAADAITEKVIAEKLTPCVNIIPGLVSVYRWKGKINRDSELLLVMKTKRELFEKLSSAIKEIHPYEVPEIIAVPLSAGFPPYLSWIDENTR
jgi:periplasmic divalent cation tolerance protein